MLIQELSYPIDYYNLLTEIYRLAHPFALESTLEMKDFGEYSFFGAEPFLTLEAKNGQIARKEGRDQHTYQGDPFAELEKCLEHYRTESMENAHGIPFCGGAVGYIGYDLCHHIEKLPKNTCDDIAMPDLFFGFYEGVIAVKHRTNQVFLIANPSSTKPQATLEKLESWCRKSIPKQASHESVDLRRDSQRLSMTLNRDAYIDAGRQTLEYIQAGDIYQANISTRFSTQLGRLPIETYGLLREANRSPFAAYIDYGKGQILSSSPERFLKINGDTLQMRPIKGTRPRGITPEEDAAQKEALYRSAKDRSELLMIVDVVRNDLGRICEPGSIDVESLYALETYTTVHHLTATIHGKRKPGTKLAETLKAVFPCGSITGAPKIRSMEIIDELEPTQRGVYTGAIGYISFDGRSDLNVAIRTLVCQEGKSHFHVGSGIIGDSSPEGEYEETMTKGKALIEVLNKDAGIAS